MKVLHQIGKIHGFIHDMAATHDADFVESFEVIWERVCIDIFTLLIMLLDQSMLAEKYILMIILHHQMMTIKGPLHVIFVFGTLMH